MNSGTVRLLRDWMKEVWPPNSTFRKAEWKWIKKTWASLPHQHRTIDQMNQELLKAIHPGGALDPTRRAAERGVPASDRRDSLEEAIRKRMGL